LNKILPFPQPNSPPESLKDLEGKVHLLAQDSENIFWDSPHVQLRMKERKVSIRQILDVLRKGKGCDGPSLDTYGDWRIKLKRFTAGRTVQVVVAVKTNHIEVITVI